jgi:cbb3-type cytochrome oxidase maturation protein
MSIIYILIPVAILLTAIGIYFFLWAVKTDQFSDLDKQGMSILFDDDNTKKRLNSSSISESVNKSNQNDPS